MCLLRLLAAPLASLSLKAEGSRNERRRYLSGRAPFHVRMRYGTLLRQLAFGVIVNEQARAAVRV